MKLSYVPFIFAKNICFGGAYKLISDKATCLNVLNFSIEAAYLDASL